MPQSLARVLIHLVFSTKNRTSSITTERRAALHAYLDGILRQYDCAPLQTGGTDDHIHTVFSLARIRSVAEITEIVKANSSRWMNQHGAPRFIWQAGYGAFSVSESHAQRVMRYIARQEEHHRTMTFQDELRLFLARSGVPYDERYLWD